MTDQIDRYVLTHTMLRVKDLDRGNDVVTESARFDPAEARPLPDQQQGIDLVPRGELTASDRAQNKQRRRERISAHPIVIQHGDGSETLCRGTTGARIDDMTEPDPSRVPR